VPAQAPVPACLLSSSDRKMERRDHFLQDAFDLVGLFLLTPGSQEKLLKLVLQRQKGADPEGKLAAILCGHFGHLAGARDSL